MLVYQRVIDGRGKRWWIIIAIIIITTITIINTMIILLMVVIVITNLLPSFYHFASIPSETGREHLALVANCSGTIV